MKYLIATDSSCDLLTLDNLSDNVSFACVPLTIRIGDTEYIDNESLDTTKLIDKMYAYNGRTSTACPSPEDWASQFRTADVVFAVTITSGLSGSYNSAMTAKNMILEDDPTKQILVIDSLATGPEMVLLIHKLNEYIKASMDFTTICKKIMEYKEKTKLLFQLENLDNLVNNGRINKVLAKVVNVLNIHMVGCANSEGKLDILHKCRGIHRTFSCILKEMIQSGYSNGKIYISHCDNEQGAIQLKNIIETAFETPDISILPTRGLCSYYAERNGILLAFEVV